jgi:hypothetical protein
MKITLYKKTHRETGLQYLGKTVRDPYEYQGSGRRWTNHIAKHGYNVDTEILLETENPKEIKKWGEYYSELWNIVESKNWANLKAEQGDGGWDHMNSKLTSEDYSRRGKLGRQAQDEYYIKNFGSIEAGRMATINPKKVSATLKEKYKADSNFREKNRQIIKLAGEAALLPNSRAKRKATYQKIGHSQGEKNSQFGTCWIYNDQGNRKIKKEEIDIYLAQGYIKGRKL